MKRQLLATALDRTGLRRPLGALLRWHGVIGLAYHRIGEGADSPFDREVWSADAEAFDDQVGFLKAHFDVIGTDDLADACRRRSGRYVLITFDDGYRDNYEVAYPILRRHGVPATFFICTGFIDNPRLTWWDEISWMLHTSRRDRVEIPGWLPEPVPYDEPGRERAIRTVLNLFEKIRSDQTDDYLDAIGQAAGTGRPAPELGRTAWMNWDMIREMKAGGMTIGGHSATHPVLARTDPDRQWDEISTCARRLAEELDQPMQTFSYPVGMPFAFDDQTRDCLRRADVRYAFSYYEGYRRFDDWDDYDVRRLAVESYIAPELFRALVVLPQIFVRDRSRLTSPPPGGPRRRLFTWQGRRQVAGTAGSGEPDGPRPEAPPGPRADSSPEGAPVGVLEGERPADLP